MLDYLKNMGMMPNPNMEKEIILITGGSGFLAQHLIKEMQIQWPEVIREIRTVDRKPFKKFLEFEEIIPLRHFQGECTDEAAMAEWLSGVGSVFHLAAKPYSFNIDPDRTQFHKDNVESTQVVINCMKRANVSNLVFVSDAMATTGWNDNSMMPMETRSLTPPPSAHWMLGPYGETKFIAEQTVIKNNGKNLENGAKLHTAVVRPTFIYGEGDTSLVPDSLKLAETNGGVLTRIGDGRNKIQMVYAGNCADMLLTIAENLKADPENFGSEVFFCTDGNGVSIFNYYSFITPFMDNMGYSLSKQAYTYESAMILAYFGEKLFRIFRSVSGKQINKDFPTLGAVRIAGGLNFLYNVTKARLLCGWMAPHDPEISMKKTVEWFKENKC